MTEQYPAMMSWLRQLSDQDRLDYISECLVSGVDNVFWEIIHDFDLRARSPRDMAAQVWEKLNQGGEA